MTDLLGVGGRQARPALVGVVEEGCRSAVSRRAPCSRSSSSKCAVACQLACYSARRSPCRLPLCTHLPAANY